MKENTRNDRDRMDHERHDEQDEQRSGTTNEIIREVSGDPDTDLNDLNDTGDGMINRNRERSAGSGDMDITQGVSYTPNDASGVRSGGLIDMDDQTAGGAGLNTGVRKGLGSHLNTKESISGSDFDGQNATS